MTALPFPVVDWVCARRGDHGNRQTGIGVGFGYAKRLTGVWEIALFGLGISAHLAAFDLTVMAAVGRRVRVSLIFRPANPKAVLPSRGFRGSVRGQDALEPKDGSVHPVRDRQSVAAVELAVAGVVCGVVQEAGGG